MRQFELTFEVPEMAEEVEDAVADELDAVIAVHSGVTTVTASSPASDCLVAARTLIDVLTRLGAPPRRLVDDLVTRAEIAERAGVTRQAVGQWIRGERHAAAAFPAPFVFTGGGLWRWGEVVDALASWGIRLDEDVTYPTRREAQLIDGFLASEPSGAVWFSAGTANVFFAVTPGTARQARLVAAPADVSTDFALSA